MYFKVLRLTVTRSRVLTLDSHIYPLHFEMRDLFTEHESRHCERSVAIQ